RRSSDLHSSSPARNRATTPPRCSAPATSSRKVVAVPERSSVTTTAACSRMLTSGACRWSSPTVGISRGAIASAASAAKSCRQSVQTSPGGCRRNFSSRRPEPAARRAPTPGSGSDPSAAPVQAERPDALGGLPTELLREPHRARVTPRLDVELLLEPARRLLEGAVLQQPREEQVARLEQGDVLGVDELALRQEPGDLEVE